MLVVGDREASEGTVSVRLRTEEDLGPTRLDDLKARVMQVVDAKRGI
jgi:threonyl-tRNA synthetase